MASIDNKRSPIEKMNCLCNTYDLVFAELKSARAEFDSERNEDDNVIPIIETKDILPVLANVIIRSKLPHLYSTFYFIDKYLWSYPDNSCVK